MACDSVGGMEKVRGEPPPWPSQAAAVTGAPEQPRRRLLDAPLRERAPRRRRLRAFLAPPAALSWRWCGVAISVAVALLALPAARSWCWCGVAVSVVPSSARWSTEKGKPMASTTASLDSRETTSPRYISSEETSRPEALITACNSTALFLSSTVGSFRKRALCNLRNFSHVRLLHLSRMVHDPLQDARLLLQVQGGHGITATLLDGRVQLTQVPPYFTAESARTDFRLLGGKPRLALNCVDSVEITKAFCTDCIAAFFSKFRAQVKWSLHTSVEDLLSCMPVGFGDMNATKVLLMGNVDVNEADPEQNTAIYLCLSVSSRTQEPRVVWFLLKNGAGVFKGKNIHCIMPVPKCVHLPEIFCFHLHEMEELVSDHQLSRSPLIANISEDSPQQVDAGSKSNIERQQDGDACRSRSQNVPIIIRHCSRLVLLTLNLDESSEQMMNLYEQKTKTKIGNRYFSYGLKRIEPDHTLWFYGIARTLQSIFVAG